MVGGAAVSAAVILPVAGSLNLLLALAWIAAFLVGDVLWFKTPSGRATVSMASTFHLGAAAVLAPAEAALATWVSRVGVNLVIQKRPLHRSLFNGSQLSLAILAAGLVFRTIAGGYLRLGETPIPLATAGFGGVFAIYYLVNTGLVCLAIAISSGRTPLVVWKDNYGYRAGLLSTMALFLLAPLVSITTLAIGSWGLMVLLLPLWFIWRNWRDSVDYLRIHKALSTTSDLRTKGQAAATVGSELNQYLAYLSASLRKLEEGGGHADAGARREQLQSLLSGIEHVADLSQGLMRSKAADKRLEVLDVFNLAREVVDFTRLWDESDAVPIALELDPRGGTIVGDRSHLRQILIGLVSSGALAARDFPGNDPRVIVSLRWREDPRELVIAVEDSGPPLALEDKRRVFEPGFMRSGQQNAYGLSTVRELVEGHGGTVSATRSVLGGVRAEVVLPQKSAGKRSAA